MKKFIMSRPGFSEFQIVYVEWAKKMVPCKFRDDFWRPIEN